MKFLISTAILIAIIIQIVTTHIVEHLFVFIMPQKCIDCQSG
jgi:hypothetical protein